MDYEKAYKDALERAREIHNEQRAQCHDVMVKVFPELKESEDDRIRRKLIKALKECGFTHFNEEFTVQEALAWLEKQCEQDSKKVSLWKHWKDGIAGNGEGNPIYLVKEGTTYKLTSCLAFECDYIELSELDNLMFEKQGEQNIPLRKLILNVWELGNIWKEITKGVCNTEHGTQLEFIIKHWDEGEYYTEGLEKQGEQNQKIHPKFKIGDIIRFKGNETLKGEAESHKIVSYDNEVYVFDDGTTDLFNEQGLYELVEQKSVNKVKPKFKVGDWCIDNEDGTIFQIVKVLDNTYTYKTNEGEEYSCSHYSLEIDAKLWTIQDAKDGDVLYSHNSNLLWIYKDKTTYHADMILDYAKYNCISINCDIVIPLDTCPATKKQRDILFQKMKEAGYEWDAEKKELRKIEQKPAWSEEDKTWFDEVWRCVSKEYPLASSYIFQWLKSIKERMKGE